MEDINWAPQHSNVSQFSIMPLKYHQISGYFYVTSFSSLAKDVCLKGDTGSYWWGLKWKMKWKMSSVYQSKLISTITSKTRLCFLCEFLSHLKTQPHIVSEQKAGVDKSATEETEGPSAGDQCSVTLPSVLCSQERGKTETFLHGSVFATYLLTCFTLLIDR